LLLMKYARRLSPAEWRGAGALENEKSPYLGCTSTLTHIHTDGESEICVFVAGGGYKDRGKRDRE
jgi:hypothetical protein